LNPPFENHDQLWERADPLALRFLPAVRPLFRGRRKHDPEHIGTCVLLRVGPARLLLTAAHVIDEFLSDDMLILGDAALEGIKAQGVRNDPPNGKPRADDPIDAGILRIEADHPLGIDQHFLTPAAISIQEPTYQNRTYLALGYPTKKTLLDRVLRRIQAYPVKYVGSAGSIDTHNGLGLHPSTHVVVDFDRKHVATDEGVRAVVSPRGMSGGGVWWWRNAEDRYVLPEARLTAIITEHRERKRVLIATRVRYHIAIIRKHWPDLVPFLEGFPIP